MGVSIAESAIAARASFYLPDIERYLDSKILLPNCNVEELAQIIGTVRSPDSRRLLQKAAEQRSDEQGVGWAMMGALGAAIDGDAIPSQRIREMLEEFKTMEFNDDEYSGEKMEVDALADRIGVMLKESAEIQPKYNRPLEK